MNCATHVEVPAVAYCRTCGKPMCSNCTRDVRGVIYCEECLASQMSGTMPPPPGPGAPAPGVPPPPAAGRQSWIGRGTGLHPWRRRFLQRRIYEGVYPRIDFRQSDLGGRPRERYVWSRHRGLRAVYADRGVSNGQGEDDGHAASRSIRVQQHEPVWQREPAGRASWCASRGSSWSCRWMRCRSSRNFANRRECRWER